MCINLLGIYIFIITVRCIYIDVRGIYLLGVFICKVYIFVWCVYMCIVLGGVGYGNLFIWISLWIIWGYLLLVVSWRVV